MNATQENLDKKVPSKARRVLRWVLPFVGLLCVGWLGTWLLQRSLRTPNKKREAQLWLEENLNAEIFGVGDMAVRINLLSDSQIVFHQMEILHPNPTFEGTMAQLGRLAVYVPPWALARIFPGKLSIDIRNSRFSFTQNEFGEWAHEGLMRPLAVGNYPFTFPEPKVSEWHASVSNSQLSLKRRGYELDAALNGEVFTRADGRRVNVRAGKIPFTFGPVKEPGLYNGEAGPVSLQLVLGEVRGDAPSPVAGRCSMTVKSLPFSSLPFFIGGIPLDEAPGAFHGVIRYDEFSGADGALKLEGELTGVPLAVFGLPPRSPLKLTWPLNPHQDGLEAKIHMGPSGYGAFDMSVPLDADGAPRFLSMRGDAAALDSIPAFFTRFSQWPQWLSRTFPSIEWRTRSWRGFGWSGDNLRLSLNRGTAGFSLTGEAEMMEGRVRLSMTPDRLEAPITIAAEKLDSVLFTEKVSRLLPAPFRASVRGSHVNLTWRGFPSGKGEMTEWGCGIVWVKPVIDLTRSGTWWRALLGIPTAVAEALPDWGGGDPAGILKLAGASRISLDQLSIVTERDENGGLAVEFRAYGPLTGQIAGLLETRRDGLIEGEFLLAGSSVLLREVEKANPDLSLALELLANESPGLRVAFRMEPQEEPEFIFIFLDDAKRLSEELKQTSEPRR